MVKRDMPHLTNEKFVKNSTEVTDFDRQRLMPTLLHLPIQATWHADEPVITFCLSLNSLPKEYINLARELTKTYLTNGSLANLSHSPNTYEHNKSYT